MDQDGAQLVEQLKDGLRAQGARTAFGDEAPQQDALDDDPGALLESDFFRAMNAFRAARQSGDAERIAAAEEAWRQVVRGELTGE